MTTKTLEHQDRYQAAAHAVQTGVAYEIHTAPGQAGVSAKHLRVGVNMAMVDTSALAMLLVKKGLITEEELWSALADGAEAELQKYHDRHPGVAFI